MVEPSPGARLAEPGSSGSDSTSNGRATRGLWADLLVVGLAALLVTAAVLIGKHYNRPDSDVFIFAFAPPLFGDWLPHVGLGSVYAVLVALAVIVAGPPLAARLRWPVLLSGGYLVSLAWTFTLALIDGPVRGLESRLTHPTEYLHDVPRVTDIPIMLQEYTQRILDAPAESWTVHVSGHPPGALLVFVWLDRLGLTGGMWAAVACVVIGCLVVVAVPVTLSALGRQAAARAALPFVVLFPGAVWIGASADGLFAGVTATGIALLVLAARGLRNGRWGLAPVALIAGVLLGFGIFLSYGLALLALLALAVSIIARSVWVPLLAVMGALAVVGVFALTGFWWWDGYELVVERYYQGIASVRPYSYWVWANIAALMLAIGPAIVAGVRRMLAQAGGARPWLRTETAQRTRWEPVVVLGIAAVAMILVADLSGMSKAEVERIWLPFAVWLLPVTSLLPLRTHRWWLAGQAAVALTVNHLVMTLW